MRPCSIYVCAVAIALTACGEPVRKHGEWELGERAATVEIWSVTARAGDETLEAIGEALREGDDAFDAASSEDLLRLRAAAAEAPQPVEHADLFRCIEVALEWARITGGAFDPTAGPLLRAWGLPGGPPRPPADEQLARLRERTGWTLIRTYPEAKAVRFLGQGVELTLDGIRDGYLADVAARRFALTGIRAGRLEVGGVTYAWGTPPKGTGWIVEIRDPARPGATIGKVRLSSRAMALAESFDDEGLPFAVDPATGRPSGAAVRVAAVIADSGADAQALAGALLVLGARRGGGLLQKTRRVEALLVVRTEAGRELLASGSLAGRLELDPEFAAGLARGPRFLLPPPG